MKSDTDVNMDMASPSGWGFLELMEEVIEASIEVQKFKVVCFKNRTSNGYLEYIFRRLSKELFNVVIDP